MCFLKNKNLDCPNHHGRFHHFFFWKEPLNDLLKEIFHKILCAKKGHQKQFFMILTHFVISQ